MAKSREQKKILKQNFVHLLIIRNATQKHTFGASCPWTSKLWASKHRGCRSVGHVVSAIFHCNMALQQGDVKNCGVLHLYFHQEQTKCWQLKPQNFVHLLIIRNATQKHTFGASCPWTSKLWASKHRGCCSVGHVVSAIFHCNMALQQGDVKNCGVLHLYFHQEQTKCWQLKPLADNLC